jgi:1,4-dihydroxy-6-naphthoate synthase
VKIHSQEMEPEVMKKHIDLYVNNYSIDLGKDGKNAIEKFMDIYNAMNKTTTGQVFPRNELFLNER